MSNKIPRTDAKLKRLSPAQQETLWNFVADLKAKGEPQNGALPFIETQFGFSSSSAALSEWLSWYGARQRTSQREQALMGMLNRERQNHPEWTDEFLFNEGQRLMSMLTLVEEDPSGWAAIQRAKLDRESAETKGKMEKAKLEQKEREIALAERRVVLLEKKISDVKDVVESKLSPEETRERLKEILK